jgi:hypothetical protein
MTPNQPAYKIPCEGILSQQINKPAHELAAKTKIVPGARSDVSFPDSGRRNSRKKKKKKKKILLPNDAISTVPSC